MRGGDQTAESNQCAKECDCTAIDYNPLCVEGKINTAYVLCKVKVAYLVENTLEEVATQLMFGSYLISNF